MSTSQLNYLEDIHDSHFLSDQKPETNLKFTRTNIKPINRSPPLTRSRLQLSFLESGGSSLYHFKAKGDALPGIKLRS